MGEDKAIPFGKYELLERLGVGGMANVYRARYTVAPGITKPVVIKRVLSELAENPTFVELFIHEARISVGLSHGNIVHVFDFGQVDGEYFLAMELVDGQPLSKVLKRAQAMGIQQLPQPLAASIAIEICKGLHHAHTRIDEQRRPLGLVHRDVSPENVLISYDGEVKLTDFGIAKAQLAGRPITAVGMVKGKHLYLSPEQARGVEDLDARSDVHAVGVLLYRMLCGRLPFEGRDFEVMGRIVRGDFKPVLEVNSELDGLLSQIVMRAMATSREERFQSAEELQQALSRWMATRAPLYTVSTLKHLMGWLHAEELKELGRAPVLPQEFLDQVPLWRAPQGEPGRSRQAPAETKPAMSLESGDSSRRATLPEMAVSERPTGGGEASPAKRGTGAVQEGGGRGPRWGIGAAAVAGALLLMFVTVHGPPPLEIHSEPPGAQVRLDGQIRGVTPLVVEDLDRSGPHHVELLLLGFKAWQRTFPAGSIGEKVEAELEGMEQPVPEPPVVDEDEPEKAEARQSGTSKTGSRPRPSAGPRITTAARPSPEVAAAKYQQGMKLLAKGELPKAKEQFWQCLAHEPSSARCFRRLGEVAAALGSTEEAMEYYSRFLELSPRGEGSEEARAYIQQQRRAGGR